MQLASRLGCERVLGELDLGRAVALAQHQAGNRLAVVGVGRLPAKRVGQARRWFNLDVLASQVEELALGWLHRDPVGTPTLGSRVTSGQVNPSGPHHSATCSGSVIASNTRCGEASTMRESLTVSWAATDAMVVLRCAFTLRAPAHGTGG
jgi:hypothetical protein